MDESLRAQIALNLAQLDALIRRGHRIHDELARDPSDKSAIVANRAWQQDIGVTVHQLSGGSKAHWLSRAFSEAFLMRAPAGRALEAAAPAEIIGRLLGVLEQAIVSLKQMSDGGAGASPAASPMPHRFDFVHNTALRPVLEQTYGDSCDALHERRYVEALTTSCGILEVIITDALVHTGLAALSSVTAVPAGQIGDWSFNDRLEVAERAGLIRGGCARLPEIARKYRDASDAERNAVLSVSEQEARRTAQVLHVVMRDLDPGR